MVSKQQSVSVCCIHSVYGCTLITSWLFNTPPSSPTTPRWPKRCRWVQKPLKIVTIHTYIFYIQSKEMSGYTEARMVQLRVMESVLVSGCQSVNWSISWFPALCFMWEMWKLKAGCVFLQMWTFTPFGCGTSSFCVHRCVFVQSDDNSHWCSWK